VGTGFKQHHRTRVKKNYDLSELTGLTPDGFTAEESALLDLTGLALGEDEDGEVSA
jgi:hypothetical protein